MLLKQIYEGSSLTIDDLLTKEEQKQLLNAIKEDKGGIRAFENIVSKRIRDKGLNVPLNIGVFDKFVFEMKQKFHPEKYEMHKKLSPETAEDIIKSRKHHLERRQKIGLDPYTGD
jgi:topoisomerase IA-like protein